MPEQELDCTYVGTASEQISGKRMSQGMDRSVLVNPNSRQRILEHLLDSGFGRMPTQRPPRRWARPGDFGGEQELLGEGSRCIGIFAIQGTRKWCEASAVSDVALVQSGDAK